MTRDLFTIITTERNRQLSNLVEKTDELIKRVDKFNANLDKTRRLIEMQNKRRHRSKRKTTNHKSTRREYWMGIPITLLIGTIGTLISAKIEGCWMNSVP